MATMRTKAGTVTQAARDKSGAKSGSGLKKGSRLLVTISQREREITIDFDGEHQRYRVPDGYVQTFKREPADGYYTEYGFYADVERIGDEPQQDA